MLHIIADEICEALKLDIDCHRFACHEYVTTVFDWVADYHAARRAAY
jgi:hypothetical protein